MLRSHASIAISTASSQAHRPIVLPVTPRTICTADGLGPLAGPVTPHPAGCPPHSITADRLSRSQVHMPRWTAPVAIKGTHSRAHLHSVRVVTATRLSMPGCLPAHRAIPATIQVSGHQPATTVRIRAVVREIASGTKVQLAATVTQPILPQPPARNVMTAILRGMAEVVEMMIRNMLR